MYIELEFHSSLWSSQSPLRPSFIFHVCEFELPHHTKPIHIANQTRAPWTSAYTSPKTTIDRRRLHRTEFSRRSRQLAAPTHVFLMLHNRACESNIEWNSIYSITIVVPSPDGQRVVSACNKSHRFAAIKPKPFPLWRTCHKRWARHSLSGILRTASCAPCAGRELHAITTTCEACFRRHSSSTELRPAAVLAVLFCSRHIRCTLEHASQRAIAMPMTRRWARWAITTPDELRKRVHNVLSEIRIRGGTKMKTLSGTIHYFSKMESEFVPTRGHRTRSIVCIVFIGILATHRAVTKLSNLERLLFIFPGKF